MSAARTLYRANAMTPQYWTQPEVVVFFETTDAGDPSDQIQLWLSMLWGCPAEHITLFNVCSEDWMLERAIGHVATGDMRLFEVANWRGPVYARPAITMMLVTPPTLARLTAAQRRLPVSDSKVCAPRSLLHV